MTQSLTNRILNANVYEVAIRTPLEHAPLLSESLGSHVSLKREDLQPVFSFKLRGAYNKITTLSDSERKKGLVAASAGNHAQGVALAAQALKIPATIVMPNTTPQIKVDSVKRRKAKVILHGTSYDDAYAYATKLANNESKPFIHPYDDLDVIAGQGTVATEMLQDAPDLDIIFIPVGGGGLIAGMAAYIKDIAPHIKVIGVESEDSACLAAALKAKRRVTLKQVGIFADGVAVKQIGKHPFDIAKTCVDDVITCSTDEICAAIKDIFDDTRSIAEPAGALAIAGLKKYVHRTGIQNASLAAVLSGANTNFDRLRHISERAEIGEEKEALLAVTIPENPGSFKAFCKTLGKRAITEFNYRYCDNKNAQIFVGIELKNGFAERDDLISELKSKHYPVTDLTDNNMAKIHIRHMVGGHAAKDIQNERLYRFQFPEIPGALLTFLTTIGNTWNISLFHYRNHGAAFGRVLVGIQVPDSDKTTFDSFLKEIGYVYSDESDNPAYTLFLK